jgi:hypothetical protein
MCRRVYLLGLGLALLALGLAFTDWVLSFQPGATEANVKRIRVGMTLEEVEALLGGPARVTCKLGEWPDNGQPRRRACFWGGATGATCITLDVTGRVESAEWARSTEQPSPLARLRAWLGW